MKEQHHGGMASVIAALVANLLVAASKFVGYFLSGSAAMLNESIHSVVDCGNQVLLIVGDKRAKHGASKRYPFGEARAKYFFSIVVAMMLFFAGGALGMMEAVEKLLHPHHEVENAWVVIGILLFGLVVELFSLRVAVKEINTLNTQKLPVFKFLKESRHSEILIIFAEDSCAVAGLLLALAGTGLSLVTGNAFFDSFSGLLIGLMLCIAALLLAREFYGLLVGEGATEVDEARMRKAFDTPEIARLINMKTLHLGPTDILLTAKIDVQTQAQPRTNELINELEHKLRSMFPHYKMFIVVETDSYKTDYKTHV